MLSHLAPELMPQIEFGLVEQINGYFERETHLLPRLKIIFFSADDWFQLGPLPGGLAVFERFPLSRRVRDSLKEVGITKCLPSQEYCLYHLLIGKNVLLQSPPGTGKTLACAIDLCTKPFNNLSSKAIERIIVCSSARAQTLADTFFRLARGYRSTTQHKIMYTTLHELEQKCINWSPETWSDLVSNLTQIVFFDTTIDQTDLILWLKDQISKKKKFIEYVIFGQSNQNSPILLDKKINEECGFAGLTIEKKSNIRGNWLSWIEVEQERWKSDFRYFNSS